jgi:hypothetical protein
MQGGIHTLRAMRCPMHRRPTCMLHCLWVIIIETTQPLFTYEWRMLMASPAKWSLLSALGTVRDAYRSWKSPGPKNAKAPVAESENRLAHINTQRLTHDERVVAPVPCMHVYVPI